MHREKSETYVSRRHNGWNRPSAVRRKKKRSFLKFIIISLVLFAILYVVILLLPAIVYKPSVQSTKEPINTTIGSYPGYNVGVSLVDINSGESTQVGSNQKFIAASTTKIITAGLVMHEVEAGRLKLNKHINDYPISWHLEQVVNQSNDDSWVALNHYFGKKKMENYARSIGLSSYDYDKNLLSASDMTTLLSRLYTFKLMSKDHTQQILRYMQHTNNDDFIPAIADTSDITVYHKYGWLGTNIHDGAILVKNDTAWALAIYTSPKDGAEDANTSTEIIHSITQSVVNSLDNKPYSL